MWGPGYYRIGDACSNTLKKKRKVTHTEARGKTNLSLLGWVIYKQVCVTGETNKTSAPASWRATPEIPQHHKKVQ